MNVPATLTARWEEFRRINRLQLAPAIQVEAMRLAFFAGAFELLHLVSDSLTSDAEPTDQDLKLLDELDREMRAELGLGAG